MFELDNAKIINKPKCLAELINAYLISVQSQDNWSPCTRPFVLYDWVFFSIGLIMIDPPVCLPNTKIGFPSLPVLNFHSTSLIVDKFILLF